MELTPEQKALQEFELIGEILAVPTQGTPLQYKRRWRLPCPDEKAFADYLEPVEKRNNWLYEWTCCDNLVTGLQAANQSGNAT